MNKKRFFFFFSTKIFKIDFFIRKAYIHAIPNILHPESFFLLFCDFIMSCRISILNIRHLIILISLILSRLPYSGLMIQIERVKVNFHDYAASVPSISTRFQMSIHFFSIKFGPTQSDNLVDSLWHYTIIYLYSRKLLLCTEKS